MNTTQLRELAEAIKGWKLRDVLQTPADKDEGVAFVGHQSDVGIFDDIAHIDTGNYMQPQAAIQIANYYAAANPAAVLALLDRIKELEAVEQAYEALKASLGDPVAFLVEGWNGKKRIACVLSHNIEDAKFSAGEFSQHYPTIHTRNLYALKEPT